MKISATCQFEKYPDGESVVFDVKRKVTHILNGTATLILDLIDVNDGNNIEEIKDYYIEYVLGFYEVESEEDVGTDFDEIVKKLQEELILV